MLNNDLQKLIKEQPFKIAFKAALGVYCAGALAGFMGLSLFIGFLYYVFG